MSEAYERLHPNTRVIWILSGWIGVGVLTVIASIFEIIALRDRVMPWPSAVPAISLMAGAALAVVSAFASMLQFSRFGYQLREADLVVQSGVLWRVRRCIPRARVQHIGIESGPIDRLFGLVNVEIFVAGGMGAVAQIGGLSPDVAERLKEALIIERTADGV